MEFLPKEIRIDRQLSDLDMFAIDFIRIIRRYTSYVVISGYVSILLGRARASEDIDMIIPRIDLKTFLAILDELSHGDFYCLNAEDKGEIYSYLTDDLAVRFAKNNTVIPNMELKFAKNKIDGMSLKNTMTVRIADEKITISDLELQVAFKETVLKSGKDLEDARHIRNVAPLDESLIKRYKMMLDEFY